MDKSTEGSGVTTLTNKSVSQNQQLAEELHKPIIRKLKKRKVHSTFEDNIWGTDLADMQLISRYSNRIRFLLCVIDIFSKYAWVVPLKDEKDVSIVAAFQSIFKKSNRKTKKIWVDKGSKFIMLLLKNGCKTMILLYIQHIMKENLLLLKDLLERYRTKFTNI